MSGVGRMTMWQEQPEKCRCARGYRRALLVSGSAGSPASRCWPEKKREEENPTDSQRVKRTRRRKIERRLRAGAIAQETYREYTLTSIRCVQHLRVRSRLPE